MLLKLFPRLRASSASQPVNSRDSFIYLDRGMQVVGWIPPRQPIARFFYRFWTLFTTLFVIILLVAALLASYIKELSSFSAGQFLTSLQVGINCCGSSIKASYTFAGVQRFKRVRELLDRLDARIDSEADRLHIHQTVAKCHKWYITYQTMYLLYAVSTFLSSILTGRLAWKLYNPLIDWQKSELHFWVAGFVEFFWMTGAVVQDLMADAYPIVYFLIIRSHIVLLKGRLKRLRTDPELSEAGNYKELINCIQDHRLILNYCDTLRPVVSATIFTQFLLCGIVMGLTMINIFFFSNLWRGLGSAIFLFDLVLQTFPFCYICNLISNDCQDLANSLFHSNWLTADRQYKITLRYFLHNVQRPIVLTAGGVFIINMATNITVAKLAFSVVTFVKQLNIAEKFYRD